MTIAVGILASDGVLVAADTEESYGQVAKAETTKIKEIEGGGRHLVVAGAGMGFHIDAFIQHLEYDVVPNSRKWTAGPRLAIQAALSGFYQDQVLPFVAYGKDERPDFDLIIGYHDSRSTCLLQTSKMSVLQMEHSAAVGAGSHVASRVLYRLGTNAATGPDDPFTLREAAFLAAHAILQAKESVPGCGKNTETVALRHDGHLVTVEEPAQEALDAFAGNFAKLVSPLLFWESFRKTARTRSS